MVTPSGARPATSPISRPIAGEPALFHELQRKLQRHYQGMSLGRFIDAVLEERKKEHQDYFATTSLLEPNVKKSPGGLRDIHLLRWIAQPRYGTRDPELLRVSGVLTAEDARTVGEVGEFLSRIRHELHFKAGGASDVLTRDEQVRVSKWLGFETQGALPQGCTVTYPLAVGSTTVTFTNAACAPEGTGPTPATGRAKVPGPMNPVLALRAPAPFRVSRKRSGVIGLTPRPDGPNEPKRSTTRSVRWLE